MDSNLIISNIYSHWLSVQYKIEFFYRDMFVIYQMRWKGMHAYCLFW